MTAMEILVRTKELEKELAGNIGLIAGVLKKRGYDLKALDIAGQDCRDYITKRVKELGIKDETDSVNIESLFVMIMMHTACKDMNRAIEAEAKERGVPEKVIIDEVIEGVKKDIKGEA